LVGSRFVDLILSEVIKEFKHRLMDPLINFEEVLIAAQMSAILSVGDDNIIILETFFEFHALPVNNRIIFSKEKHGRHFNILEESGT